jgi:heme/copper-type cytochrome/quinol oxidase subunit 3
MSSESLTQHGAGYAVVEGEPPEVLGRNLVVAGYLLAGATAFFFVAFLFGFFYLRSLNNAGMWKPSGVKASVAWGTVVVACIVASALLLRLGLRDRLAERFSAWRIKGVVALLLGVASLVLQAVAWTQQGFGPADGGYASIYFGWTAFLFLFIIGVMIWLEMTLATSFRYARMPIPSTPKPGEASGDPYRTRHDISDPLALIKVELVALSFYWMFLAGIAVVTWIVLYLG